MKDLSGQVIKSYELLQAIGEGGFGTVYRARQANIQREVAVKIILPQHANHPDFVRRFETEAQLVARLEHPHIVPLYDYWREPDSAYLVMRYLRAGSLRDKIDREGAVLPRQAARILMQIGAALSVAHRNGVIHRDLKSDNILLDEDGNAYLTDFGIAKDLGDANMTKDVVLGTPAYLSPEQIRGETVTPESDLYTLGIMMYEVLTGAKPYGSGHTPATLLYKHLNEPMPDLQSVLADLPAALNLVLQRATAKDPAARYHDALEFANDFYNALDPSDRDATTGVLVIARQAADEDGGQALDNPYKGLRAFQQADAADFFGRGDLVQRLLERLREDAADASFLAVVGPSGSGKSSVVKAGLLPALRAGGLPGSANWFITEMVPGDHPMQELEAALLAVAAVPLPNLVRRLRDDVEGLIKTSRLILSGQESGGLVLVIDQFEEIFTRIEDPDERAHFLRLLARAAGDSEQPVTVIITLRADFYDRPLLYAEFGDLIRRRTELVLPLSPKELQEAILGPAERAGARVEQALVSTIINDVMDEPGALPLLQYALTELFERREGRTLTLNAYREIGGTLGALARRAEELYGSFDDRARQAVRQLFLRLVTLGEGTEDTRRRVLQSELVSLGSEPEIIQEVVETFGRYRLLTFDRDPTTRTSTVEVAHEALIRQWERLRGWLADSREELRLQRRLTAATEEWQHAGRDRSFLARGVRLQQFEEWARTSDLARNEDEEAFLRASMAEHEAELAAERERQAREALLEQRSRGRLRMLVAVFAVAAVLSLGLALLAFNQSQLAQQARAEAEQNEREVASLALAANARSALIENTPIMALALAREAIAANSPPLSEVVRVLATTAYAPGARYRLEGHEGSVLGAVFSPDGTLISSGSVDGTVRLWDAATGQELLVIAAAGEGAIINSVSIAPDNALVAAGHSDGLITLYNTTTGEPVLRISAHEGNVHAVAFSPDGDHLASGGDDTLIYLWDVAAGEAVKQYAGHTGQVFRLAFSPDGRYLVSGSGDAFNIDQAGGITDRTVRLWDVETEDQVQVFSPQSGFVRAVAYSPDGRYVASGTWDGANGGTVRLYDIETGEEVRRFFAHTTPILGVVFTPDGASVISAAWDHVVRVWDVERGVERTSFDGFADRILSIDISPDGQHLLITQGNIGNNEYSPETENPVDTSVWVWDLVDRATQRVLQGHRDWTWAVDLSPDGRLAASGSGPLRPNPAADHSVRIWDVATGEEVARLEAHTDTVDSVRFGPDGTTLLSSGWDGQIILWDLTTGQEIRRYEGHEGAVYKAMFTADGTQMLSAGHDGTARLWDLESGQVLLTLAGHEGAVNGIDISPDGAYIVTAAADRLVRLWDAATGQELRQFSGHTAAANEAIFSPDGLFIVSSSWDTTVRLWNVLTGQEVRQFTGHNGHTFGLAFSNDGRSLLTTSQDRTVRLWDVDSGEELFRFDGHTDWIQEVVFGPDDSFAISAGQDNTLRVWNIPLTGAQVLGWLTDNRYHYELTPAERERFRLGE